MNNELSLIGGRFTYEGVRDRVLLAWRQSIRPWLEALYAILCFAAWVGRGFFLVFGWYSLPLAWILWRFWGQVWDIVRYFMGVDVGLSRMPVALWTFATTPSPPPPPPPPVYEPLIDWIYVMAGLNIVLVLLVVFLIAKPRRVMRVCEHGYMVEKTVQGSEYITCSPPDFIGEVWTLVSGTWMRRGTFFRVGPKIFTAGHVIAGVDRVRLHYRGQVREVTGEWSSYDLDMVATEYEPFADWQMGAGKFVKTFAPSYVAVHNGQMQSYGRLSLGQQVGFVEFDGSTSAGFSGSPYFAGRRIFGMHTGCGVKNVGLDGAFMLVLTTSITSLEALGDELTDPKALLEAAREQGELEYRYMANDNVSVRVGGRYYYMSEDDFERVGRTRASKRTPYAKYEPEAVPLPAPLPAMSRFDYADVEDCSGNGQGPAVRAMPQAGRVPTSLLPPAQPQPTRLVQPPPAMVSPLPQPSTMTPPTSGLTPQRALQNAVSAITSGNLASAEDVARLSKNGQKVYRTLLACRRPSNA